jgi:polysaccharide pyruvyl transferase WcaK-like protein
VNAYTDHNKGSAALTIAALRQIRRQFPDASIGVVPLQQGGSGDPANDFRHTMAEFGGIEVLPPLFLHGQGRWGGAHALLSSATRRALNKVTRGELLDADLVVSRGGVVFHAREGDRFGLASLLVRTLPTRLSSSAGIPTALYGAQFGPFPGRLSRQAVQYAGGGNVATLVRDSDSCRNFTQICGRPPGVMPDSVFGRDYGSTASPAVAN